MKNQYFGTDGIRGKVGYTPITPEFILKLGWAAGKVLASYGSNNIIIGHDTRISGYMLESVLEAGLAAAGISASLTGPMPTPAIAYLTRKFSTAGIVISASHNQFYDNGIKLFSSEGTKLPNTVEKSIEAQLKSNLICVASENLGQASRIIDAKGQYIEFCKSTFPVNLNLNGLKVVVDCANGATYHIAPSVLRELGAKVVTIGCNPNGININKECGTTDIRKLQSIVLAEHANIGIAYDGDGDRIIMVDHLGYQVDGDKIIYIVARDKMRQGKLTGGVVGTQMSNIGLEYSLKQLGIPFVRTNVGERYVLETMQANNWCIGAENSGHVILLDHTTTSDGIIAGLQVLSAIVSQNIPLHDLCNDIKLFPQKLVNVRFIGNTNQLDSVQVIQAYKKVERTLANRGRVLLRKSGTENIIRVLVEGYDEAQVKYLAYYLADTIEKCY
ncbi:phosphoglucosamine mutase [Candidatus Palibaumannia cicadellinicola]|uniref:Phosphoglucosamine mutase n=1 Tax=Candidatus Palibaumannia cicadellinicola TaxID=186490 RepID=A0A0K2BLT8_9GAMM|nr:phosphoglucosamine mutase [Candidatus Baumannia cicadellinicola]AKZ66157.1 Phosphoglucosamine mutase [Candidatus Baumannia cicadellinicola]